MRTTDLENGARDAERYAPAAGTTAVEVKCYYVWDARGNGAGGVSPTLTGDHENRVTDYTAICVTSDQPKRPRKFIVRRLTPLECCRLQGFPDGWADTPYKDYLSEDEYKFWLAVRKTHAELSGKAIKDYTMEQMLKWYNGLHTDSAEYKMWGNGIALPCAVFVLQGITKALQSHQKNRREI